MKKLFTFLIILAFALPVFPWEGDTLRELMDVTTDIDPSDEYILEYDTTTELWVPVARLEAEDLSTDTTNFDGALSVADDTIQAALDTLDDAIPTTASDLPIVDSGSIITATEVEGALQENRTAIDLNTAADLDTISDRGATTDQVLTTDGIVVGDGDTVGATTNKWLFDDTNGDISCTGNVGIGTTGPVGRIHVVGDDATKKGALGFAASDKQDSSSIYVQGDGFGYFIAADTTNDIEFVSGVSSLGEGMVNTATLHALDIRTNNVSRIHILPAGNVGIATKTPDVNLDVEGATGISIGEDKAGGTSNDEGILKLWSDGDNAFYTQFKTGTQTQNITLTLPLDDGDANQVLSTNGDGVTDWVTKVEESTTVTSPLVLTTYDVSIPAATNTGAGHATASHIQAIEANTAKDTNVSTALSVGTVGVNTVAITSDGGADDVTLPAATVSTAGMLTTAKWGEIVANNAKNTNVSTALSAGTVNATTYGITSDGGADDIVLPEADTTNAGLLGSDKWDEIVANTTAKHTSGSETLGGDLSGVVSSAVINPDALVWQEPVIDKDLSTPPSSGNAEGDRYIVASVASGDWTGYENKIAQYISSAWNFYNPQEGWFTWIKDENRLYKFDGSSWGFPGTAISNVVEDTTPQLGGDLDMNGHNIGGNSEAQIDDTVTKAHTQNSDTDLDATFEATFVKKLDTINVLSDISSAGANIEDAVTKKHTANTDTALGAQTENLDMNTHKIVGVTDPTADQDVATKKYVDDNGGGDTLPVVDTTGIAKGSVDATKIVRLEVDGLTTATTRVLTVQDKDYTIADTADVALKSPIESPTFTTKITTPIIDLTGGQIAFPATAVPSADPNTIDDYEEGTYTPVVTFGGGNTGITYTIQTGIYTKTGRVCHYKLQIHLSSKGSSTGYVKITIPFAANGYYQGCFLPISGITFTAECIPQTWSNNTIGLVDNDSGSERWLTNTAFVDTSHFSISGFFFI